VCPENSKKIRTDGKPIVIEWDVDSTENESGENDQKIAIIGNVFKTRN